MAGSMPSSGKARHGVFVLFNIAGSMPSSDYDEYLTTYDVQQGGAVHFSACLIYDQQSREIVTRFVTKMNEINPYLIFFDPYNDILPGSYENDALAQIIEERCAGKVLVFLPETDNFINENMDFALQYAKHLDAAGKKRCVVPVQYHENTFWPKVLKGLKEIDMHGNNSLQYWVQQSRQFRPSFSPKGPLRKECIQYNRSYSYPLVGHQSLQTSLDGQYEEDHSSRRTTYPLTDRRQAENGLFGGFVPLAEELGSLQIDNGIHSNSISYQNDTSLGSSQYSFEESDTSTNSLPEVSIVRGNEAVVSDVEAKEKLSTRNAGASQPHEKKDKRTTKFKKWLFSFKKNAD